VQKIQAKWFHRGRRGVTPRLIVIHCTVSPESGTGAEAVAEYFARGERRASAHRTADNNSTVISVDDGDTAFAAAGANQDGLHLELVGQPQQSAAHWADEYSTAELVEAGATVREWSADYDIPLRWLTVAEVADGKTRGLCTHDDVSKAFPAVSTGHWDPGPNFPKAHALRVWANTDPEDDMPLTDQDLDAIADRVVKRLVVDDTNWLDLRLLRLERSIKGHATTIRTGLAKLIRSEAAKGHG
jgi:N-acetylmuramoyl-L-alanine amidase